MNLSRLACCCSLFFAVSTCFAQMYTVTDLGTLGGNDSWAYGINAFGQVVGNSLTSDYGSRAFRTSPNTPINPATDDLGALGPDKVESWSWAYRINDSGQVIGSSYITRTGPQHSFRTAPNSPINPVTDDLGTLGGLNVGALAINASGQVVGVSTVSGDPRILRAFRTLPNSPINPATDDLGTLSGDTASTAADINDAGQVAGASFIPLGINKHAFRTAPNSPINPTTDDLGTLGGCCSEANAINAFGQVVGTSLLSGNLISHAFRTAPNSPINPVTDDLGTLGGSASLLIPTDIDDYSQVVGAAFIDAISANHAFVYSGSLMQDLNNLIPATSDLVLISASAINNAGQIVVNGSHGGKNRAFLLTPIYKSFVQQPINKDGTSIFLVKRGVVPVKFSLNRSDLPTCSLLPATIAVTRITGGVLGAIDESDYSMAADNGANFRMSGCQYSYNLAASSLGVGTYRVDISINGIMVGHAMFALK